MSNLRARLQREVDNSTPSEVARRLELPRNWLVSYLLGTCPDGINPLVEERAAELRDGRR